ncbi:hypothetical protein PanWU01x14_036710, partial [Parasponia andersonii]
LKRRLYHERYVGITRGRIYWPFVMKDAIDFFGKCNLYRRFVSDMITSCIAHLSDKFLAVCTLGN